MVPAAGLALAAVTLIASNAAGRPSIRPRARLVSNRGSSSFPRKLHLEPPEGSDEVQKTHHLPEQSEQGFQV